MIKTIDLKEKKHEGKMQITDELGYRTEMQEV